MGQFGNVSVDEMACSMYEAMGFRTVVSYAVFKEPTPIGQETPVPPSPQ